MKKVKRDKLVEVRAEPVRVHVPVPVAAAREIAERYGKSMVVILSYDPKSKLTHMTTYGVQPKDKETAADVGEQCAKLICGEGFKERTSYEDYRFLDQGRSAQRITQLTAACKAAELVLSVRATEPCFKRVLVQLRSALAETVA